MMNITIYEKEKYEMKEPAGFIRPKYVCIGQENTRLFWTDEDLKTADLNGNEKIYQIGHEVTVETKIEIVSKPVYRGPSEPTR